jgi:hypothetical protein
LPATLLSLEGLGYFNVALNDREEALLLGLEKDQRLFGVFSQDGGTNWQRLESGHLGSARSLQMVLNNQSQAAACWVDLAGNLKAMSSSDGGKSWSATVQLASGLAGAGLQLAGNASGQLLMVYSDSEEKNPKLCSLWSRVSRDGGKIWSEPKKLFSGQISSELLLAFRGDYALVLFKSEEEGPESLLAISSCNGGRDWEAPRLLSKGRFGALQAGWSFFKGAANFSAAEALAVWEEKTGGANNIKMAASSDGGQNWSSPAVLALEAFGPRLMLGSGRRASLFWQEGTEPFTIQGKKRLFLMASVNAEQKQLKLLGKEKKLNRITWNPALAVSHYKLYQDPGCRELISMASAEKSGFFYYARKENRFYLTVLAGGVESAPLEIIFP